MKEYFQKVIYKNTPQTYLECDNISVIKIIKIWNQIMTMKD